MLNRTFESIPCDFGGLVFRSERLLMLNRAFGAIFLNGPSPFVGIVSLPLCRFVLAFEQSCLSRGSA